MAIKKSLLEAYRRDGTFGELLEWHLGWGTQPGCSTTLNNKRWGVTEFVRRAFQEKLEAGSGEKTLGNWRRGRNLPGEDDEEQYRLERVYDVLFGPDPELQKWKDELNVALNRGREDKAKSTTTIGPSTISVPQPTPYFRGRARCINDIAKALNTEVSVAILVQGGPGIGKTELIKTIANSQSVIQRFRDRRFFASLESSVDGNSMRMAIMRACGCTAIDGILPALSGPKGVHTLLLLDSVDSLWESRVGPDAVRSVLDELSAVPKLSIIASFRGSESVGLLRWKDCFLGPLPKSAATDLFVSIAGDWVKGDRYFANILEACGGIPLAIQLLARRAHGRRSLCPLWAEWKRAGDEIAVGPGVARDRQTSLTVSIELSVKSRRMTKEAIKVFTLLGYLPGGMRLSAIVGILGQKIAYEGAECLCHVGLAVETGEMDSIELLPPVREYAYRNYRSKAGQHAFNLMTPFTDVYMGKDKPILRGGKSRWEDLAE